VFPSAGLSCIQVNVVVHCENVANVINYYDEKKMVKNAHSQKLSKFLPRTHLELKKSFSHMPYIHIKNVKGSDHLSKTQY
jgi:hypothetical protein